MDELRAISFPRWVPTLCLDSMISPPRPNGQFSHSTDQLREANQALKDANRELADLRQLRAQLEAERDSLAAALKDTEDALRDAEAKLANAQAALNQLRTDMENRLREKDEEIENIRSVNSYTSRASQVHNQGEDT